MNDGSSGYEKSPEAVDEQRLIEKESVKTAAASTATSFVCNCSLQFFSLI